MSQKEKIEMCKLHGFKLCNPPKEFESIEEAFFPPVEKQKWKFLEHENGVKILIMPNDCVMLMKTDNQGTRYKKVAVAFEEEEFIEFLLRQIGIFKN